MPPLPSPGTPGGINPGPALKTGPPAAAPNSGSATGAHSVFVTILGEVIGISILAIFADSSDGAGKAAVALMSAWLLVWLMLNAQTITSILKDVSL